MYLPNSDFFLAFYFFGLSALVGFLAGIGVASLIGLAGLAKYALGTAGIAGGILWKRHRSE
jgi:hypothetical protein